MNKKVYEAVKSGKSDYNINYTDFQNLIIDLGFCLSVKTGHTKFILMKKSKN